MSDSALSSDAPVIETGADAYSVPPPDRVRRFYRVLTILAPLSIVLAIALNWWMAPDAREMMPSPAGAGSPGIPGAVAVKLEKPAVQLLPTRILTFEPLTHQAVPGFGNRAGEAVYKTLNMNTEAQIAIVTYARVEGFATQGEAQARLDELMTPYSAGTSQYQSEGGTVIRIGKAPDRSTIIRGWVRGQYMTIVKTSFQDFIPEGEAAYKFRDFQNEQVTDGVDVYQLTGREGVSK